MRFQKCIALAAHLFALTPICAHAGAWTLEKHHWQTFSAATISVANKTFGKNGSRSIPTKFSKLLIQNTIEFGLTDSITLFAVPDFVIASSQAAFEPAVTAHGMSVEAGARVRLTAQFGQLSLQSSYKDASAFDLSNSARREPARQIELRLLYGTSFNLFGSAGFSDIQLAKRWIGHERPNEVPLDLTAGAWLTPDTMAMIQSFNIISSSDATSPFDNYRSHKLQLSLVQRLADHWSLQIGAFMSPAGRNALDEKGISLVVWTQS